MLHKTCQNNLNTVFKNSKLILSNPITFTGNTKEGFTYWGENRLCREDHSLRNLHLGGLDERRALHNLDDLDLLQTAARGRAPASRWGWAAWAATAAARPISLCCHYPTTTITIQQHSPSPLAPSPPLCHCLQCNYFFSLYLTLKTDLCGDERFLLPCTEHYQTFLNQRCCLLSYMLKVWVSLLGHLGISSGKCDQKILRRQ